MTRKEASERAITPTRGVQGIWKRTGASGVAAVAAAAVIASTVRVAITITIMTRIIVVAIYQHHHSALVSANLPNRSLQRDLVI